MANYKDKNGYVQWDLVFSDFDPETTDYKLYERVTGKSGNSVRKRISEWRQRNGIKIKAVDKPTKEEVSELITASIKTPQELVDIDLSARKESAKYNELKRKYDHLLKSYDESELRFDTLLNIKEQPEIITVNPLVSDSKHEAVAIVQLSDWHVEEKVDISTINGLNEYNLEIARYRFNKCIQNSLKLVHKERYSSDISQLVVILGGDFITGYIHEELEENNYLSPTQATRFAKELIITALKFYKEHGKFKTITVICNYGNHGRTTKKSRVSTGYKNSYEHMMYLDVADYMGNGFNFLIPQGMFAYCDVMGRVIRCWHGDNIRYGGGIGGLTIPLYKIIHRLNTQRIADYNFIGHFHQLYQATKDCFVNGSGIGFSPYAQMIGASPEEPMQGFYIIDKKYGMTVRMPIFCK